MTFCSRTRFIQLEQGAPKRKHFLEGRMLPPRGSKLEHTSSKLWRRVRKRPMTKPSRCRQPSHASGDYKTRLSDRLQAVTSHTGLPTSASETNGTESTIESRKIRLSRSVVPATASTAQINHTPEKLGHEVMSYGKAVYAGEL